jgi:hypothetical protein
MPLILLVPKKKTSRGTPSPNKRESKRFLLPQVVVETLWKLTTGYYTTTMMMMMMMSKPTKGRLFFLAYFYYQLYRMK